MSEKEDALTKTYDLMIWLFPQIGKFPRDYRFVLGDRIENGLAGTILLASYERPDSRQPAWGRFFTG